MKEFMKIKISGWLGRTHSLMSIMIMCICMLIPIDLFKETFWLLKENILFFIVGVIVLVGGALLPDLDNCQSSAGSTLGPLGSICTIFMQSTSSIIWNLCHAKGDKPPMTQHRYFWHTLVAGLGMLSLFMFGLKNGNDTIINCIKQQTFLGFLENNVVLLFLIIIIFMAVLCGSDMIMYRLIKFFKLPKILSYICPVAVLIYVFTIDFTHLHILGICIGFGYLFHIIEDFFADSGVPLLWPIPIHKQMWHRCRFIITCETGGIINTIVDAIILIIDICLIMLIFLGGGKI